MCRQSRLRGRIHARPSAGGLAVLYVPLLLILSSVLLSFSPASLVPYPSSTRWSAGPGGLRTPSRPASTRSPPTRSSRTCPPCATLFTIRSVSRASASIKRASSRVFLATGGCEHAAFPIHDWLILANTGILITFIWMFIK